MFRWGHFCGTMWLKRTCVRKLCTSQSTVSVKINRPTFSLTDWNAGNISFELSWLCYYICNKILKQACSQTPKILYEIGTSCWTFQCNIMTFRVQYLACNRMKYSICFVSFGHMRNVLITSWYWSTSKCSWERL